MSAARIKQIDKEKNALSKKVDLLIAKHKKLYSNMDITSAKSPEEKQLDKEISDLFSKIQALIREKRKLINFGSMPIKKKPISEKDKLNAKTIEQLKRYAKKVGAKIVTPDGKAKTKQQLVNSIVMKERLAGKSLAAKSVAKKQTGKSNTAKDKARKALNPGQRISAKGKKYYEYRRNRSDVPGTLLGEKLKYRYISSEAWRKTPADNKSIINGVKYKMYLDETRGTILAPVKIKKL